MNTTSYFRPMLVSLLAAHAGLALADGGNIVIRRELPVTPYFQLANTPKNPQTTTVNPSLGVQRVFHAGLGWDAARHARLDLPVGTRIDGPAILEQPDTTVWLEPGFTATVDTLGNLLVCAV